MAHSSVDSAAAILPLRAVGYKFVQADEKTPFSLVNTDTINTAIPHTAGAIISTTHDLHHWQKAMYGGKWRSKLLSKSSLAKMLTVNKGGYSLGVQISEMPSKNATSGELKMVRRIKHGCGVDGFGAWMQYNESNAWNVVVLGNIEGALSGYLAGRVSAMSEDGLPYETTPFYLRGSVNKWDVGTRMVGINSHGRSVDVELDAGSHEFKFGSEDFRQIDFGGSEGVPLLGLGFARVLYIGGSNLKIKAPQAAKYRFSLNVRDACGPKVSVVQIR